MAILDDWAKLPATERNSRLGQLGVQEAIVALGTENGVAFLETHIESPVGADWGIALFALKAPWSHLERWLTLSRFHCLAAVDALRNYAAELVLPAGANAASIHSALDKVQAVYSSPRIKTVVKEIRHTWPLGERKRQPVEIPHALARAANIVLHSDAALMSAWHETLANGIEPMDEPELIWESLLDFAQSQKLLAIVDWRASLDEIVANLRSLQTARSLDLPWDEFTNPRLKPERSLKFLGAMSSHQGMTLVQFDRGADDRPLMFLPSELVSALVEAMASLGWPIMVHK